MKAEGRTASLKRGTSGGIYGDTGTILEVASRRYRPNCALPLSMTGFHKASSSHAPTLSITPWVFHYHSIIDPYLTLSLDTKGQDKVSPPNETLNFEKNITSATNRLHNCYKFKISPSGFSLRTEMAWSLVKTSRVYGPHCVQVYRLHLTEVAVFHPVYYINWFGRRPSPRLEPNVMWCWLTHHDVSPPCWLQALWWSLVLHLTACSYPNITSPFFDSRKNCMICGTQKHNCLQVAYGNNSTSAC